MNKLVVPNGGMYLEGDDLRFWDDGIREAIGGMFSLFSDDGYLVISGLEISNDGNTITVTEGFVLYDNEILYSPEFTFPEDNVFSVYQIALNVSYDPSGLEVFVDSASRDTYEIRQAEITKLPNGSATYTIGSLPRLADKLSEISFDNTIETNINSFELIGDWEIASGSVFKRIKQGNRIYLEGLVSGGASGSVIYNLPSGYRPTHVSEFIVPIAVEPFFAKVVISNTNGSIAVLSNVSFDLSPGENLSLDGITFLTS